MKIFMKNTILMSLLSGGIYSQAYSLPDPSKGNPLPGLNINTPEGMSTIYQDKDTRTLYVGPRDKQKFIGQYSELGSTGPQCADLVAIQANAYRTFDSVEEMEDAFRRNIYVSNYFQLTFTIPRKNVDIIDKARDSYNQVRKLSNGTVAGEYIAIKDKYDRIATELSALASEKQAAKDTYDLEVSLCVASPDTAPTCIREAAGRFSQENIDILKRKKLVVEERNSIEADYLEKKSKWIAIEKEIELIRGDVDFYQKLYNIQIKIAKDARDIETDIVQTEGHKVVGLATASYNVFNGEVAELSNAISGRARYNVSPLDIFNIQLNSGITRDNPSTQLDNQPIRYANTIKFPKETLMNAPSNAYYKLPIEKADEENSALELLTTTPDSYRSGGYEMIVTKGARCGEYSKKVEMSTTFRDGNGIQRRFTVERRLHEPGENRGVLSVAIGLTYNYYAYPGPIEGECEMNIDKSNDYWRSKGKTTSTSFWSSSTHTWDDTKQTTKEEMGLECTLTHKPQGANPEESARLAQQFERSLYDDMFQMFVAIYAKEYKIESVDPELLPQKKPFQDIGTGLAPICGSNIYCQIGAVVLKSMDELGGHRAQGSTSSEFNYYGKIRKSFKKDSYIINQNSLGVEMRACVDRATCQI